MNSRRRRLRFELNQLNQRIIDITYEQRDKARAERDEAYLALRTIGDVLRRLMRNYYVRWDEGPLDEGPLVEADDETDSRLADARLSVQASDQTQQSAIDGVHMRDALRSILDYLEDSNG